MENILKSKKSFRPLILLYLKIWLFEKSEMLIKARSLYRSYKYLSFLNELHGKRALCKSSTYVASVLVWFELFLV